MEIYREILMRHSFQGQYPLGLIASILVSCPEAIIFISVLVLIQHLTIPLSMNLHRIEFILQRLSCY